jgi:hypothetical protein
MTKTKKNNDRKKNQLIPQPLLFPKRRGVGLPPLYFQERGVGGEFKENDFDRSSIFALSPKHYTLYSVLGFGILVLSRFK